MRHVGEAVNLLAESGKEYELDLRLFLSFKKMNPHFIMNNKFNSVFLFFQRFVSFFLAYWICRVLVGKGRSSQVLATARRNRDCCLY